MKVFLDDSRATPEGWTRTYTVEQTLEMLKTREVTHLSLDNDLGEGLTEGYVTLDWLEETIFYDKTFPMPEISIHSANSARVEYMKLATHNIERIRQEQVGGA